MGCPDAVRANLLKLNGVLEATYHLYRDLFTVRYESVLVQPADLEAAVVAAGKAMGQEYRPKILPTPPAD